MVYYGIYYNKINSTEAALTPNRIYYLTKTTTLYCQSRLYFEYTEINNSTSVWTVYVYVTE